MPRSITTSKQQTAEEAFLAAWKAGPLGSTELVREYKFLDGRRFRFDFAIPSLKVAIEIEGRGRHQTVAGYRNDCEKYNLAAFNAWVVFRFPATDIKRNNEWGESVLDKFVEDICLYLTTDKHRPTAVHTRNSEHGRVVR